MKLQSNVPQPFHLGLLQILWSSSGWSPISLTNLIGGTQVKKAYQKARLCLHPDKLQQRGATMLQKYVADKAFTILQVTLRLYTIFNDHLIESRT